MATGTAWYNLTKPASTENYNLSIWNTNLDMIDEQMHQNETESFTGATDLANGTVGNVPAPQIADKEKFLKGDGTWDTPSGGGGDASAMKLTQAEYDALTQEEKENGTIYFVGTTTPVEQLIPRVSGADSAITSSGKTQYSGGDNWHAFDGVENTSGVDNCWAADENNTSAYIQYHFSQPYYLTQIQLKLYSHYSGDWTGTLNILGSNDGSNWTNISSTGHAISVTAPLNEINIKTIDLNSNNAWDYIRVQANGTAFNIAYQPTCDFSEIYVYGTSTIVVEDHDIYYMGDKYTNNTGSGGSSTLDGLTDVDISSPTNGQILKYNSTTQKWENADESGGSKRTYLGQLIPRVSAADSKITASTSNSSYAEWGAFNATSPSDLRNPSSNSCWLSEPNLVNQYIQYHFDAPRYFTKIGIICFSNYSADWVGDIKVEGSTDGSTWTNILTSGTTYELTAEYQSMATVEIDLDDTDLFEYIRVTFIDEMSVYYQPSCFIDEIYVYGGEEISGGGTDVIELTQSEYNALPDEEKNNGCIYMVSSQASTPEELTEAQTNTSTAVTASSYNYDTNLNQYHYPWCAFNRVSPNPNEMAYPTPGVTTQTCWTPNVSQDGSNSWICYHFDKAYKMTSMTINSFTDYSSSATKSMVIEGSNDGTNWTNILLTGNSFSLNSNLHTLTPNNVNLNSDTAYEYVRLRSLEPMGASYQPSVFIDEIFVYGYKSEKALKRIYYMGTEYGNTGGGGGSSSHVYSTTEQKVGTWIDGSDVWEKTINIEETTIHGNTSFTIDIETNIDVLIEYSLMYRDIALQNGRWNPLDNVTDQISYDMYRNRLYLESNGTLKGDFTGSSGVVTICGVIRYTKVSAS